MKNKPKVIERGTVHFTVDPAGITDLVRSMWWGERKCAKSLNILVEGFRMNLDQALSVISGHKKLISDDGINFGLADDKPLVAAGPRAIAPTFEGLMTRLKELEERERQMEQLENYKSIIHAAFSERRVKKGPWTGARNWSSPAGYVSGQQAIDFLARHIDEPTDKEWKKFWEEWGDEIRDMTDAPEIPESISQRLGEQSFEANLRAKTEFIQKRIDARNEGNEELADKWSKHTALIPEINIAHMMQLDKMPAPKPTTDYKGKLDGWLLPNGKFYAFRYMEHIWAAYKIAELEEREAEDLGWIKLSDPIAMGHMIVKGRKKPTQAQLNTLFDWCEANGKKLPDWATEAA